MSKIVEHRQMLSKSVDCDCYTGVMRVGVMYNIQVYSWSTERGKSQRIVELPRWLFPRTAAVNNNHQRIYPIRRESALYCVFSFNHASTWPRSCNAPVSVLRALLTLSRFIDFICLPKSTLRTHSLTAIIHVLCGKSLSPLQNSEQ